MQRQKSLKAAIYSTIVLFLVFNVHSLTAKEPTLLAELEKEIIQIINQVRPNVVTISAKFRYNIVDTQENSFLGIKKGKDYKLPLEMENVGSGIVLDSTHIVTIASIVKGGETITATFANGETKPVQLIGLDDVSNLAILKVENTKLQPAQFGDLSNLQSGCCVLIVGNSLGVSPAVSLGLVNAIRKDGAIQLTASVAAGSIGGPVFDIRGRVIGILAAQLSSDSDNFILNAPFISNEGALAYPIDFIAKKTQEILQEREFPQGWIGVSAENLSGKGGLVHISNVKSGSPAAKAGLRTGDIIFNVDGRTITNAHELAANIKHKQPGQAVQLGIIRGNQKQYVKIIVGNHSSETATMSKKTLSDSRRANIQKIHPGKRVTEEINQEFLLMRLRNMEQELNKLRSLIRR